MQLYGIEDIDVEIILTTWQLGSGHQSGRHSIVGSPSTGKHEYPLKIVASVRAQDFEIITVYPLKKGVKQ